MDGEGQLITTDAVDLDVNAKEDDFTSDLDYEDDLVQDHDQDQMIGEQSLSLESEDMEGDISFNLTENNLEQQMINNPALKRLIEDMVAKQVQAKQVTPTKSQGNNVGVKLVKSPSDTTIYAPGLQRILKSNSPVGQAGNRNDHSLLKTNRPNQIDGVLSKIDNFIKGVCDSVDKDGEDPQVQPSTSQGRSEAELLRDARDFAGRKIIEAEKFHATVEPPKTGNAINQIGKFS